ncbi:MULTISPECIES: hypothetical protein [Gammaproteobacteria]|uniref:Uncharacterized protein n=2 Tax=Gammaproteobacteria TaxID=1236 RepID=A0AAX3NYE9_9GAMM|nr:MULTISPECIES: hypothetical protein [Gammaproteobacteria]MDV0844458.1 hypothetical protein [Klebsiella quasipneumoniae subsp. quasipneumoniae]WED79188.1 hypothetical protein PYU98_24865 [Aeromonas allosaccharophila]
MKLNDCLCRRYTFSTVTAWQVNQTFIGFKVLREPSSSAPGQLVMVEICQVVINGKAQNWSEQQLGNTFEANSFETIPMVYQDQEKQHVSKLIEQGYVYLDEVLVNATTRIVQEVVKERANTSPVWCSVNWLFTPPPGGGKIYKKFLNRVFAEAATLIEFKVERDGSDDEQLSGALMRTDSGFELRVDRSLGENTIHPDTLEGAGEIRYEHGYLPLLILIYLQQQYAYHFVGVSNAPWVTFCDEQGNPFEYSNFDSLVPFIERFGFSYDEVRKDAERLGLASALIRLAGIETEQEDLFF